MLFIPRKKDESLAIGDNIVVTVIEIQGDKVRLGIEGPNGGLAHKREVYEVIRRTESVSE